MGGYGGALKQLSIGVASSYGKAYIHGAGVPENIWTAEHDLFLESMADAAKSIVDYFNNNIVYINIMKNMSVDCDCCAKAEDPCMKDIGILSSTDPVSISLFSILIASMALYDNSDLILLLFVYSIFSWSVDMRYHLSAQFIFVSSPLFIGQILRGLGIQQISLLPFGDFGCKVLAHTQYFLIF